MHRRIYLVFCEIYCPYDIWTDNTPFGGLSWQWTNIIVSKCEAASQSVDTAIFSTETCDGGWGRADRWGLYSVRVTPLSRQPQHTATGHGFQNKTLHLQIGTLSTGLYNPSHTSSYSSVWHSARVSTSVTLTVKLFLLLVPGNVLYITVYF